MRGSAQNPGRPPPPGPRRGRAGICGGGRPTEGTGILGPAPCCGPPAAALRDHQRFGRGYQAAGPPPPTDIRAGGLTYSGVIKRGGGGPADHYHQQPRRGPGGGGMTGFFYPLRGISRSCGPPRDIVRGPATEPLPLTSNYPEGRTYRIYKTYPRGVKCGSGDFGAPAT